MKSVKVLGSRCANCKSWKGAPAADGEAIYRRGVHERVERLVLPKR